jgi:galactoside O-acetyltransferase
MSFLDPKELKALGLAGYGKNVLISRKCSIYGASRIELGDNVRIDDFCVLSAGIGGIKLGSYIHIAAYSSLIGRSEIRIYNFAGISSRVSIYSSNDDYSGAHMTNPTVDEQFTGVNHQPVFIGRHAIIGAGSIVLPGVTIGEGVAIGALSLVNRDCKAFGIYIGVPARQKGERKRDLLVLEQQFMASCNNRNL